MIASLSDEPTPHNSDPQSGLCRPALELEGTCDQKSAVSCRVTLPGSHPDIQASLLWSSSQPSDWESQVNDSVKLALISALVSIATALITAYVTITTSGVSERAAGAESKAAQALNTANEARDLAATPFITHCTPADGSSEHARMFDLKSSTGKLIFLSANGRGTLRSGGGGRIVLRADISVAG